METIYTYKNNNVLQDVCRKLENSRKRYGRLYKFEIHIHTPASSDYQIHETTDDGKKTYYKDLSIEYILKYALEIEMITESEFNGYLNNLKEGLYGHDYMNKLREKGLDYVDFKEYFTYKMIAYKLYKEEIEGVIITDHNTIAGYDKLKSMISYCYNYAFLNLPKKDIWVILGIEISCSDKNHVVAIIDEKNRKSLERFIEDNIVSDQDSKYCGTIEHSLTILKKINEIGGKAYIAHINSSNFKYLTGTYKNQLFNSPLFDLIGVTKQGYKIESTIKTFSKKTNSDICVFYESDSHGINTLGIRNTWIKMQGITYGNLLKAIFSHQISVYPYSKPEISPTFIKGIYIPENDTGFLNNNASPFYFNFSKDLTCIVGGRGTGKSTILKILDVLFSQEVENKKTLNFISKHGMIYILFRLNNQDYILRFIPQINTEFSEDSLYYYAEDAFKRINSKLSLNDFWFNLYAVSKGGNDGQYLFAQIEKPADKENILSQIYKKHYSISTIISSIEMHDFSNFIKDLMFSGETHFEIGKINNDLYFSNKTHFLRNAGKKISSMSAILQEWQQNIASVLQDFNLENKDILSIQIENTYDIQENYLDNMFDEFLDKLETGKIYKNHFVDSTTLKWFDVYEFIRAQIGKLGVLRFLEALYMKENKFLEANYSLKKFVTTRVSEKTITHGLEDAEKVRVDRLYKAIRDHLANSRKDLVQILIKAYRDSGRFTLKFNVNAREDIGSAAKVNMKNVEELSLGQKVVAILTFIINYGKYSNDITPLIIDQPEDNLDNQYIYKTLVKSLQQIKNNRQVIIVTHNSTLVVNTGAEQIIVLETSDGFHSSLKSQGYIGNKKIIEHIINYLEGGNEAFQRKVKEYNLVLSNGS